MTKNIILKLIIFFLISIIILMGVFLIFLSFTSYNKFIDTISKFSPDKNISTMNSGIFEEYKYFGFFIMLIAIISSIFYKKIINYFLGLGKDFKQFTKKLYDYFFKDFYKNNKLYFIFLCLIVFISILIRIKFLNYPIRADEAFSFYGYAKKPLILGLSDYSSTNNHLLNTFLVHISYLIFGNNLWSIRLPALISGILIVPTVFLVGKVFFNDKVGLIASIFVSSSSILIEYSTNSRGYSLQILLFLLMLIISKYVISNNNKFAWFCFLLINIFGFYTIPTMLYPLGCFYLVIIFTIIFKDNKIKNAVIYKRLLVFSSFSFFMIFFLYLPVLLRSGIESLVYNKVVQQHVQPLVWKNFIFGLPVYFKGIWLEWNRDFPIIISIILLIIFIFSLTLNRKISKLKFPLFLSSLIGIMLVLFIQRILTFSRFFLFLLPIYVVTFSSGIIYIIDKIIRDNKKQKLFFIIFLILVILISPLNIFLNPKVDFNKEGLEAKYFVEYINNNFKKDDLLFYACNNYVQPLVYYIDKYSFPLNIDNLSPILPNDVSTVNKIFIITDSNKSPVLSKDFFTERRSQPYLDQHIGNFYLFISKKE